MRKSARNSFMGALALFAGFTFAISTYPQIALAQTQGMQRRDERRDTRQTARDTKHACNASGQASRSGCRQAKHHAKQVGRQD
ncbi:MAG TPA: hypothetical protein VFI23_11045 [Rhizomicrobium sp.]|nr:hypothetical protein [Rhizomicrobium sp.]